MKRKLRRTIFGAVALVMSAAVLLTACGDGKNKPKAEISVWSATSTEKILQDKTYEGRSNNGYAVKVFKNEAEAAQVIFTPTEDIGAYAFSAADLENADGDILEEECFEIYHEKYVEILESSHDTDSEHGSYPDCLLPMSVAESSGENTVKKGENQGIWIETICPEDQPAGVYTGSFTLTADGESIAVPASVTVYDYTLTSENHTRSVFYIGTYWWSRLGLTAAAELDTTIEMYDKYAAMLLKYRANPGDIVDEAFNATGNVDYFVERLLQYREYENFNTYTIPYVNKTDPEYNIRAIDYDLFLKYIDAVAEASVEQGVNLFEGATTYFQMYDEASLQGMQAVADCEKFFNKLFDIIAEHIEQLKETLHCPDEELKTEILNGIRDIQHLYVDSAYGLQANVTNCPMYGSLHDEDVRKQYTHEPMVPDREQEAGKTYEKWWYSATSPAAPAPNLHIDNELNVPRLEGWMRYENDVNGYLYWAANFTIDRVSIEPIGDFYGTTNRMDNGNGSHGDGFLMYPGKPYGVDGPLPSIRLSAFRDACEDYELLLALEEEYAKVAESAGTEADVSGVYGLLKEKLYSNMKYNTNSDIFAMAREELAQLLIMAKHGGAIVKDAAIDGDELTYELLITQGQTAEFEGRVNALESSVNGAKLYTVRTDLSRGDNEIGFSLTSQYVTGQYSLRLAVGGKREAISVNDFADVNVKSGLVASVVTENDFGVEGPLLAVTAEGEKTEIGFIADAPVIKEVDSNIRYIEFDIYCDSDEDVNFTLYATGTRNGITQTVYSKVLKAKTLTHIRIECCFWNFRNLGTLSDLELEVSAEEGAAVRGLYMTDMAYIWQMSAMQ